MLEKLEIPVKEIVEAAKLKIDRCRLQKILDDSPLKYAANEFAKSSTGLDDALAALEWLSCVRRLVRTAHLLRRLSSSAAVDEWERAISIARLINSHLQIHTDELEKVSGEFGVLGFESYEPKELAEITATLVEHGDELREYESVLNNMVAHVIKSESPIYEDLLVVRIARAHGFQRSGERIQATVSRVLAKRYRKTQDDGRTVIWAEGSNISGIVPYRESNSEVRSHVDIPIAELASLAVPFIRVRLADDDILYRMADHFKLGRLREPTRVRFQSAVNLARNLAAASSGAV